MYDPLLSDQQFIMTRTMADIECIILTCTIYNYFTHFHYVFNAYAYYVICSKVCRFIYGHGVLHLYCMGIHIYNNNHNVLGVQQTPFKVFSKIVSVNYIFIAVPTFCIACT